nr:hypothetical protein [Tanacetum cinerariifolium]
MPPIPLCVHLAAVFQHEAMKEQHWDEYYRRNWMELSEKMRQRDAAIGALEQTMSNGDWVTPPFTLGVFVIDPCKRVRANEIKGGCQVGLRAKSHGVLGRVEWYCSGTVRVHRKCCGGDG